MGKIFVVTDGELENMQILAAFDREADAEAYNKMFGGFYVIEKVEQNPLLTEAESGLNFYVVVMQKNGNYRLGNVWYYSPVNTVADYTLDMDINTQEGIMDLLTVKCLAKSESEAVGIANNIRLEMIENNEWS